EPMLVLPADHLIQDEARFAAVAKNAEAVACQGGIALFGIRPTMPETGFGYIECESSPSGDVAVPVKRFVEKPNAAAAAEYLASGHFLWNSGMFCFTPATILAALGEHAPAVLAAAQDALPAHDAKAARTQLAREAFEQAPNISIDYAVMEKSAGVVVFAGDFGWSDIGSWKAVADEFPRDQAGNTTSGDVLLADCRDTYVQSDGRLIAAVGLRDVVIIDTDDAVLVCDRNATQRVKEVVAELKRLGHDAHKLHRTVARPWGTYTTLQEGPRFKIKRIVVKPGGKLSLQMHHHRNEHWVVVEGMAKVTNNGSGTHLVAKNESTFIAAGHKHRLENPGVIDLVIIEVQSGEYLGEDDIVRFEDQYGRTV
ncbi:MAG: mannose-1-phosphate guanylyltransferase/mannose-6-phosphate isomerase, partial [Pseudomonas sp.]